MSRRITLDGQWEFKAVGSDDWMPGNVPGCVQMDLIELGQLPDPYIGLNEIEMHRIEDKAWVYRKVFTLSEKDLDADSLELVFEGIDTLADVYLNDAYLGRAENMFYQQRYDIAGVALAGENMAEVRFDSPVETIRAMERNSPLDLASSAETARVYARKAQYSYGWDWGPRIAAVGLWRPVYVELNSGVRISQPYARTISIIDGTALVRVSAQIEPYVDGPFLTEVALSLDGKVIAKESVDLTALNESLYHVQVDFEVPDAALWWPNGKGAQPLYEVGIKVGDGSKVFDRTSFRTGIRTIQLIQEADTEGKSFILAINGVKTFCKGANWIPAEAMLPRLTRDDYYELIGLARDANMNMLRIWGGGIYEDPAFYEACDEMGIMVWQDFMYSCAQYPDEFDWFQDLAADEAEAVVLALRNHPSIVLWCGNNENNWGFDEWWHVGEPKYLGNYVYREILPAVCAQFDPSRPYWVSSPYGGEHPNCKSEGDTHSWMVWSNWQDYSGYLQDNGRFISEFGFQAMPNWETVLEYTTPEERRVFSPTMLSHQKMVEGMEKLVRFMVGRVGFPKDFKSFCQLTQFVQAEAIRTGVEHWRSRQFMTSGALYWQLNDCWPVASWSSVDYARRRKGLWYYTQRFFDNVLPMLRLEDGRVQLRVASDVDSPLEVSGHVTAYRLDGKQVAEVPVKGKLLANGVTTLDEWELAQLGIGYSPRVLPRDARSTTYPQQLNGELLDTVLYVELSDGASTWRNYLVFDRFRTLQLVAPQIKVAARGQTITLTSAVPAFGVFIETENGVTLSDNCLNLEPGVAVKVTCSAAPGKVTAASITELVSDL
ncbi:MAG: glycoside hydrolase family 2 protein [Chloroflexi bacterium]|nr:glycoside hydrolase family 2 protein [Chloroflexota bacterium]